MGDTLNGAGPLELLDAVGLRYDAAWNQLSVTLPAHPDAVGGGRVMVVVTDADRKGVPTQETTRYSAVALSYQSGIKDIMFETDDARDVMAFVVANANEQKTAVGDHGALAAVDTFVTEGQEVSNPFADEQYGDWNVDREPSSLEIHLAHPALAYPQTYVAWRDERARLFLEPATAPAMG